MSPPMLETVSERQRHIQLLSDIVFGLAMTLPAGRIPLPHGLAPSASILDVLRPMLPFVEALAVSFLAGSMFWASHRRCQAATARETPIRTAVNLAFLTLVMPLPVSTCLYGTEPRVPAVGTLYATHLLILELLLAILWGLASVEHPAARRAMLTLPILMAAIFGAVVLLSLVCPSWARSIIWVGLAVPPLYALLTQRRHRK